MLIGLQRKCKRVNEWSNGEANEGFSRKMNDDDDPNGNKNKKIVLEGNETKNEEEE